uniref:Uncharacterized protein n=1 Tax=Anguilla anguilla TaxID=7936 RepID=A0A0E9WA30_ANGAN
MYSVSTVAISSGVSPMPEPDPELKSSSSTG